MRPPGWLQAGNYSAENDRLNMLPFVNNVGSSTVSQFVVSNGWDGGVGLDYSGTSFKVNQRGAGANMSVDVWPGFATVPGQSTTTQGMYTAVSDATVNLAIATSNPTNPRIDLVYLQLQDAAYSGSNNQAVLAVVTGTPAGSPVTPALPANSIPLARVAVAANASSVVTANITDVRLQLGAAGGLVQAPSGFMPLYAPNGQVLYQPDTGAMKVFGSGFTWEDFMQPGAWQTYSPVWGSSGTAPSLGNGTLQGRYHKLGRKVVAQINWVAGSTTAFGTGNYTWTLPFASANTFECSSGSLIGTCANNIVIGVTDIVNPNTKGFAWAINTNATANANSNTQVGATNPHTFVNGDSLRMLFVYESAA